MWEAELSSFMLTLATPPFIVLEFDWTDKMEAIKEMAIKFQKVFKNVFEVATVWHILHCIFLGFFSNVCVNKYCALCPCYTVMCSLLLVLAIYCDCCGNVIFCDMGTCWNIIVMHLSWPLLFLLITAKDRKTIFFSSHDVSKPDSGSYLSEVSFTTEYEGVHIYVNHLFFFSWLFSLTNIKKTNNSKNKWYDNLFLSQLFKCQLHVALTQDK